MKTKENRVVVRRILGAALGVAAAHQHLFHAARLRQRHRIAKTVHPARAAKRQIHYKTVISQPQPILQNASRLRRDIVPRHTDIEKAIHRIGTPLEIHQQPLDRLNRQVAGRRPRLAHPPTFNTRRGDHLLCLFAIRENRQINILLNPPRNAGGKSGNPNFGCY